MDVETIKSKLKSGELILADAERLKIRSAAYSKFRLVCDNEEIYVGFVTCTTCKKLVKHDIHLSGTTHLHRHTATHASSENKGTLPVQQKMTGFVTKSAPKVLNPAETKKLRSSLAFFCAADLRPFSAVEGIGFKNMAQTLVALGSKHGNIAVTDILPSRTTVAESCRNEVEIARATLVTRVNVYMKRYGLIGVTTDMWQEEFKKKNFVAVTVHMLDNDRMVSRVLQVYQFPAEIRKSADNIQQSLTKMAECLGIEKMSAHFYFVTDQGSNIKAALSGNYQRLACACHCLATALKHALPGGPGDKGMESEELQGLKNAIDEVKSLVRFIKKSGLNATLAKTVVQENDTRWNSTLMMLESVLAQETEIKTALEKHGDMYRVENIDFSLLKAFASFLQPLKIATKKLEGDSYPTLQDVVLQREKVIHHLKPTAFEMPLVTQLKTRLLESLQTKFIMTDVHKLALFLHPEYKGLRKMAVEERAAVHDLARSYMAMIRKLDVDSAANTAAVLGSR